MRQQLRVIRFRDEIGRVAKPIPQPKTPTERRLERNIRRLRSKVRDQRNEINMLARELSTYMNLGYHMHKAAEARLNRTSLRDPKRYDNWRSNIRQLETRMRQQGRSWENVGNDSW